MSVRRILFACAGALALGSCVTAPPPLTAETLLNEPYTLPSAAAFDVAAFFAALPERVQASYADAHFDSATGAVAISELVLAFPSLPDVRIHIDRANIWRGDVGAVEALAAGEVTGARALIFERASFEGVRSEGLYWNNGAQTAALSIDKLVYDGLAARNIAVTPKDGAPAFGAALQKLAAVSLAFKFDGAAYSNLTVQLNENQGSEILMNVAQVFVRGYDGGRTDYQRVDGYSMTTRAPNPAVLTEIAGAIGKNVTPRPEDKILQPHIRDMLEKARDNPIAFIAASAGQFTSVQEIDVMEVRNVDIAGGLRWLAKWELPPISETELLDFGSMTIIGSRESWDSELVSAVDRTEVAASDFYWLVPSHLEFRDSGVTVAALKMFDVMMEDFPSPQSPSNGDFDIRQVREALVAMGLETIRYDDSGSWRWDGASGLLDASGGFNIVDFASISHGANLDGPSLAEWDALMRAARANGKKIDLAGFSLNKFWYSLTDKQMLDRLFTYVAGQAGSSPEEMRAGVTAMVRQTGAQMAGLNPRIAGYGEAIASFIETGGTIDITVKPAAPVTIEALAVASQTAPDTLPDMLNLEITHTPAQ